MKLCKIAVLVVALALVSQMAWAGQGDKMFRFHLGYVEPTGDYKETFDETPTLLQALGYTIEADSAIGPEVGFEYMFNDKVGFDVNLGYFDHDVEISGGGSSETIGDVTMMPLLFGANFHLTQDKNVDFYVGPTVGYVMFGDLDFTSKFGGDSVGIKDDFGYGVNLGLDVPINDKWSFSTGLRYFVVGAEIDESGAPTVDIDPIAVRVGAAVNF
jgi:outer membrane protein